MFRHSTYPINISPPLPEDSRIHFIFVFVTYTVMAFSVKTINNNNTVIDFLFLYYVPDGFEERGEENCVR